MPVMLVTLKEKIDMGIRIAIIWILLLSCLTELMGQKEVSEGKVTFTTADNVYVRFTQTDDIQIGDTIYIDLNGILRPCLNVTQKSSSSVVSRSIDGCTVAKDQKVFHKSIAEKPPLPEDLPQNDTAISDIESPLEPDVPTPVEEIDEPQYKQRIRGRVSAATYSSIAPEDDDDTHRFMSRFNIRADHLQDSKWSIESYFNYRINTIEREVPEDYQTRFFRVYNLALTYDLSPDMWITAGRKINRRISSLGAIDGLQAQKFFNNYYVGAIVGSRPDLSEFGYEPSLFQYGAYGGYEMRNDQLNISTTVGLMEQRNSGMTDRRYAYLQSNSTIARNLNLFASAELDLYNNAPDSLSQGARLTNFYISTRYRFSRKFSVSASFDSRKRIVYYETLRSEIERILADDESRQGIRLRATVRPYKYINAGVSYGKRYQSSGLNSSDNINTYVSYSKVPTIEGRVSLTYNINTSNYLRGNIISIRYSRNLIDRKLDGDFYFRKVQYRYIASEFTSSQNYYGASFSLRISRSIRFNILGEYSTRLGSNRSRINMKLSKRFDYK